MIPASFEFRSVQCMASPSIFLFSMSLHSYSPTNMLFGFVCLGSSAWDRAIGTCAWGLGLTTSAWELVLETAHKMLLEFHFESFCVIVAGWLLPCRWRLTLSICSCWWLDCFQNASGRAVYSFWLLLVILHRSRFIVGVDAGIIHHMVRLLSSN